MFHSGPLFDLLPQDICIRTSLKCYKNLSGSCCQCTTHLFGSLLTVSQHCKFSQELHLKEISYIINDGMTGLQITVKTHLVG